MNLSELLHESCVLLGVPVRERDELLERMVDSLVTAGTVSDRELVLAAIRERERVMSTGIGGGIAIPHAQSKGVDRLAVAIARSADPLDFAALDGKPVSLFFMIVGPEERGWYIRVLSRISRLLYTGDLQKSLLTARTPSDVLESIQREEAKLGA